ncbi:hypothetical protein OAU50_00655 [Planctomycetota bacterium]|nr:hypothetical protein [Planctomycetota bacterium]
MSDDVKQEDKPETDADKCASEASQESIETDIPEIENLGIPLWVKLMWLVGIAWMIWYVVSGLSSEPATWA